MSSSISQPYFCETGSFTELELAGVTALANSQNLLVSASWHGDYNCTLWLSASYMGAGDGNSGPGVSVGKHPRN